jgi:hypothetical protein
MWACVCDDPFLPLCNVFFVRAPLLNALIFLFGFSTRWFKYDQSYLCVNKSQFVPVIFEPPCTMFIEYPFLTALCLMVFSSLFFLSVVRGQAR